LKLTGGDGSPVRALALV